MFVLQGIDVSSLTTSTGNSATLERVDGKTARFVETDEQLVSVTEIRVGGSTIAGLQDHIIVEDDLVVIDNDFQFEFPEGSAILLVTYQFLNTNPSSGHVHTRRTIFPADRCTWSLNQNERGYGIYAAQFHPTQAAAHDIAGAALGYIGKSGRFVEIAD